jgi:hypothetical protein
MPLLLKEFEHIQKIALLIQPLIEKQLEFLRREQQDDKELEEKLEKQGQMLENILMNIYNCCFVTFQIILLILIEADKLETEQWMEAIQPEQCLLTIYEFLKILPNFMVALPSENADALQSRWDQFYQNMSKSATMLFTQILSSQKMQSSADKIQDLREYAKQMIKLILERKLIADSICMT